MDGGDGPFPVRVAHGARALEAALLEEIAALAAAGARDPRLLRRPVRVIVPSRSLRAHVAAALMRHAGRAIAGVKVQTLMGMALEIVEPFGDVASRGEALFPILVRQYARDEPALRDRLDELVDGYGIVADDITDLLDAGFTPEHAEALADALEELERFPALVERARAALRVAVRTLAAMKGLGVGHRAQLLTRARDHLERDPAAALPARAVLVHGFAEATGLRAELLEALVRHRGARVFLDEPPDPADPHGGEVFWRFSERLRTRLVGVAGLESAGEAPGDSPELEALEAPGAHAEVRALATRIRGMLDSGQAPEAVAVVARNLSPYRAALRQHLGRLGIPFSGVGESGSPGAVRRRTQALLDVLQRRGRVPADRWLDAVVVPKNEEDLSQRADLRLALRRIGAARLAEVAKLSPLDRDLRLPVVGGWRDGGAESGPARAAPRILPRAVLTRAVASASGLVVGLDDLARAPNLGARLTHLRELLVAQLGWNPASPECAPVFDLLDALAAAHPPEFELHIDDFLLLLRRCFDSVGVGPIGGAGGGVQILTVMEARARTFDALFVLGLNRDGFPRSIRPDPLFPDVVRRAMSEALPDLPIKATGHDEERYLFAQLLAASPRVTLSWQGSSDDGRECVRSTLVEGLVWGARGLVAESVPALQTATAAASLHTPAEDAVLTGLFADRDAFADAFGLALAESARAAGAPCAERDVSELARGRLAVLAELDPPPTRVASLGPYFGFAGEALGDDDPRRGPIWVTTLESVARCPWQAFLERLLRLEAPPDPLAALPGSDPRVLGTVVHRTLDAIAAAALPGPVAGLDEARERGATAVAWPDPEDLARLLEGAAREALAEEGIALSGLERVLAGRAQPLVERAGALDWRGGAAAVNVLGSELNGAISLADAAGDDRELRFRADRVDLVDGVLVLTDYKTGRAISQAVQQKTRTRHWLQAVARGRHLQAIVYARAAGAGGRGRFLFLKPDLDDDTAEFSVAADAAEFSDAFAAAVRDILSAWDHGTFLPRLLDEKLEKENPDCDHCELAIACLRGDSGARGRLRGWLQTTAAAESAPIGAAELAFLAVGRLQESGMPGGRK